MKYAASVAFLGLALAACGGDEVAEKAIGAPTAAESTTTSTVTGCADVVAAEATLDGDGTYTFSVTVSSADTGVDKYADAWEVRAPDGTVLGTRILTHPHENEQPFTRSQSGIAVPGGITDVIIAARDTVVGFCGDTVTVRL